jgi:type III restriction enzyme
LDLVEELSENTGLSYTTLFKIVKKITNLDHIVKNPPQYIHIAAGIIRNIELDEMLRGLDYELTGETYPFDFKDFVKQVSDQGYTDTPNKGVFDKVLVDSYIEHLFARGSDLDPKVVCFLKLPNWYKRYS